MMQLNTFSWLIFAASLLLVGCEHRGADNPGVPHTTASSSSTAGPKPETTVVATRLSAAQDIGDSVARNDALSKLALDAAAGGDGATTRKAIGAIGDSVAKNEAASKAALILAKARNGVDANAVARLIGDSVGIDNTLAKIAKGELGE
jgi:hypothetical protein